GPHLRMSRKEFAQLPPHSRIMKETASIYYAISLHPQNYRPPDKAALPTGHFHQINMNRFALLKRQKDPILDLIRAALDDELLLQSESSLLTVLVEDGDSVIINLGDDPSALVYLDDVATPQFNERQHSVAVLGVWFDRFKHLPRTSRLHIEFHLQVFSSNAVRLQIFPGESPDLRHSRLSVHLDLVPEPLQLTS